MHVPYAESFANVHVSCICRILDVVHVTLQASNVMLHVADYTKHVLCACRA